jgi:hypothetical protein
VTEFYRTERGITLRIITSDDGGLNVQLLKDGSWEPAPVGMMGLRLSPGTRRLRAAEIKALPA